MSQGIYENIIIYGCGVNGIHLYYRIRDAFNVTAFADRAAEKHGYVLNGLRCLGLDELEELDKDIRIIVSIGRPKAAISDLVLKEFRNVCTTEELYLREVSYNDKIVSVDSLLRMKCMLESGFNDANKENFDIADGEIFEIIEDFKERHSNENS